MIVVHPHDPSTVMLGKVYEGLDHVTLFDSYKQRKELLEALVAAPLEEPVLLLGHGCPYGLYDLRYGLILDDGDAELLKNRPNLIGIWCYASSYAAKHNLKGFFSGMFISEGVEASYMGVDATEAEANRYAWDFSERLGGLLRQGLPLESVAKELMDPKHITNELTHYNYTRLTWRPTGREPLPAETKWTGQ
jgi:hypothetical protein